MAYKVQFGGYDLMLDGEGNFGFTPGVFTDKSRDFVPLARSSSLLMRELSTEGAQHGVELRFYAADVETVATRLKNAWDHGIGTLKIRGRDDVANCAMAAPPQISQVSASRKVEGGSLGMRFVVSVVFVQVA